MSYLQVNRMSMGIEKRWRVEQCVELKTAGVDQNESI